MVMVAVPPDRLLADPGLLDELPMRLTRLQRPVVVVIMPEFLSDTQLLPDLGGRGESEVRLTERDDLLDLLNQSFPDFLCPLSVEDPVGVILPAQGSSSTDCPVDSHLEGLFCLGPGRCHARPAFRRAASTTREWTGQYSQRNRCVAGLLMSNLVMPASFRSLAVSGTRRLASDL